MDNPYAFSSPHRVNTFHLEGNDGQERVEIMYTELSLYGTWPLWPGAPTDPPSFGPRLAYQGLSFTRAALRFVETDVGLLVAATLEEEAQATRSTLSVAVPIAYARYTYSVPVKTFAVFTTYDLVSPDNRSDEWQPMTYRIVELNGSASFQHA